MSKRRYYLNKKEQNNSYSTSIFSDQNKIKNIKLLGNPNIDNRRYIGFNSNTSEVGDKIDINHYPHKYINNISSNETIKEKKNNNSRYFHNSNDNNINNSKNNKKDNFYNSPPKKNNFLNRSNVNTSNRNYNFIQEKLGYENVIRNNKQSPEYSIGNYYKYNNKESKYNKLKNNINNYNKFFMNQSYDYAKDIFNKNKKDEKKYSVILPQNKSNYISLNHYRYNDRKKIIKIQSAWRGYFLRKLAVGSIKKYIGFVALMKYLEKIFDKNLKILYNDIIDILKKYTNQLRFRYKYKKIDITDMNNNNNNNNRRRFRNFRNINSDEKKNELNINNEENNREEKNNMIKKNLFKSVEFTPIKNLNENYKNNKINEDKNKKGITIYFLNNEKEKEKEKEREQIKKEQIEREKESEKRRIEREQRRKEQLEREKEFEKRRKERLKEKEKEKKEKEKREEKERLEKEKLEKERLDKIREREIEKEKRERRIENERKERIKEREKEKEKEKEKKDKKEKNENNNYNEDDIFSKPLKIIYIPKKISGYKPLKGKYYFKRLSRDKKIKIENFVKFLIKIFYRINFPDLIYQIQIIKKSNYIQNKNDSLYNIIKLIEIKRIKKYLKIYRENVLNEKVKEEFLKKNILKYRKINQKNNITFKQNKYKDKENKYLRNKNIEEKGKEYLNKIEEENEEMEKLGNEMENLMNQKKDIIKNNNDNYNYNKFIENKGNEEEKYKENKDNAFMINDENNENINRNLSLLNKIINKKIKLENKNNSEILYKYYKLWKKNSLNGIQKPKIKFNNLHSPDMEIRGGNKSKKKHIKVKFSRAMTSKTSIGSIKSDGKSSSSLLPTKKMRIKNMIVNSRDYLTTSLININNNSIYNHITNSNNNIYKNVIKLLNLIDKMEGKKLLFKCFKNWKKNKK